MPRPTHPDRYPVEFHRALDAALAQRELIIPTTNPAKLRMQFYGFIGALRREGNTKGDLIEVIARPDALLLRHRSANPQAREIAAALAAATPPENGGGDNPESVLFDRLSK